MSSTKNKLPRSKLTRYSLRKSLFLNRSHPRSKLLGIRPLKNSSKSSKVIAIVGPTGSGKTEWAKILANKFQAKIISFDSRQIYKGMDIGTGKDKTFKQALIDIVRPDEPFSVARYQKLANGLINQYLSMKTLPLLAGGTGLYLEAVLYGYAIPGLQKQSQALRVKLEKLSDNELVEKLGKIDPESALKIDPKNRRRVIRALEVSILSKRPFSKLKKKFKPKYDALIIGIDMNRQTLYSRIDARVDQMIKAGLVEEVRGLLKKYQSDLPALNTIGYKEIIDYLYRRQTLKMAIQKIKYNTHAYVRRQETWFRRDKNIKWVSEYKQAEKIVEKFLRSE